MIGLASFSWIFFIDINGLQAVYKSANLSIKFTIYLTFDWTNVRCSQHAYVQRNNKLRQLACQAGTWQIVKKMSHQNENILRQTVTDWDSDTTAVKVLSQFSPQISHHSIYITWPRALYSCSKQSWWTAINKEGGGEGDSGGGRWKWPTE